MKLAGFAVSSAFVCSVALLSWSAGCSSTEAPNSGFTTAKPTNEGVDSGDGALDANIPDTYVPPLGEIPDAHRCVKRQCDIVSCGSGVTTNVSGTVYDPAGKVPLYNVIVYIPNADVEPFKKGATCDQCGAMASGSPIVTAVTDAAGKFTLKNVPVGTDVPLVIQVGKWRRQVKIPKIDACKENVITDKDLTRLPRNQAEGDLPQMALTTGGCDALECLFRKMGIDESEFTAGSGTGRMHLYNGSGGSTVTGITTADTLWSNTASLMSYDMVLFSCECSENLSNKKPAAFDALHKYAEQGGRIFGTHYHYVWFLQGAPDFQSTAAYTANGSAGGSSPFTINQSFPKGQAFADWLVNVGASTVKGKIPLKEVSGDVTTVNASTTQEWIYSDAPKHSAKYLTFNTPIGKKPADQCGRVVYSDLHVASGSISGGKFPSGCKAGDLTEQEKALEFLFFDLSACVQDPGLPPPNPPVN